MERTNTNHLTAQFTPHGTHCKLVSPDQDFFEKYIKDMSEFYIVVPTSRLFFNSETKEYHIFLHILPRSR